MIQLARMIACMFFFFTPINCLAQIDICVRENQEDGNDSCLLLSQLSDYLALPSIHDENGNLIDDINVEFMPGTYFVNNPIVVDQKVTGSGAKKLTFFARKQGDVVLSGAKKLNLIPVSSSFAKKYNLLSTTLYAKLANTNIQSVTSFPENAFGVAFSPGVLLFENGVPSVMNSIPSAGYEKTIESVSTDAAAGFTYTDMVPRNFINDENMVASGYFLHNWAHELLSVKFDQENERFVFDRTLPKYGVGDGKRFKILNVLYGMKKAGRWYWDAKNSRVFINLNSPDNRDNVYISNLDYIFNLNAANNVSIDSLSLTAMRKSGLYISGSSNIAIDNVSVTYSAGSGIIASGNNIKMNGVVVGHTGSNGISLNSGDRKTLLSGGSVVSNCSVSHMGESKKTYTPAISLAGVGNVVEKCELMEGAHAAIIFSGNDHVIRNNRIHDVVLDSQDAGAIYACRDWSARGTVIEYNNIYNVGPTSSSLGAYAQNAVYLDDQTSGITVQNNIIRNVGRGILVGGGRDNFIFNNVIQNCKVSGITIDARGIPALGETTYAKNESLFALLSMFNITQPPYSTRYPALSVLSENEYGYPGGNQFSANIFAQCRYIIVRRPAELGFKEDHSIVINKSVVNIPLAQSINVESVLSDTLSSLNGIPYYSAGFLYE